MKFYLSSYKIGNQAERLKELMPKSNRRIGYIPNALDFSKADPQKREESIRKDMDDLKNLGLEVELVDLRDYFGQEDKLKNRLSVLGGVWVRGGNVFILRQAMKLSGLDEFILKNLGKKDFLYAGYSAGICVLAPSLKPLEIVDDATETPYKSLEKVIWEGLGVLDYVILPHYRSDHPETAGVEKTVDYCKKNRVKHKTLRDGEVIIIE